MVSEQAAESRAEALRRVQIHRKHKTNATSECNDDGMNGTHRGEETEKMTILKGQKAAQARALQYKRQVKVAQSIAKEMVPAAAATTSGYDPAGGPIQSLAPCHKTTLRLLF